MIGIVPMRITAMFILAVAGQITAIGLLPRTVGFTASVPKVAALVLACGLIGLASRLA